MRVNIEYYYYYDERKQMLLNKIDYYRFVQCVIFSIQ